MCTKPFLIARAQTWTTPKFTFAHSVTAWAMPCPWPLPYTAEVPCKLPESFPEAPRKQEEVKLAAEPRFSRLLGLLHVAGGGQRRAH